MACLKLQPRDGEAREVTIEADETSIGRAGDNTIVIDDPAASGHHCVIVRKEGTYTLRDLDSTNGTLLNGAPVGECTLASGDTFTVGGLNITLVGNDVGISETAPLPEIASRDTAGGVGPGDQPPDFGVRPQRTGLWVTIGVLVGVAIGILLYLFIASLRGK